MFSAFAVFNFNPIALEGLSCVMPANYYATFRTMCIVPVVLCVVVIVIYAFARAWHRASLARYDALPCHVGIPARLHVPPLAITLGGREVRGAWGWLDYGLDRLEDALCRRRRPARGRYAALATAEAALDVELSTLGFLAYSARLRTLRSLGALASPQRNARIWNGLTMLRDDHNMLGGRELCACIPRNPRLEEEPPKYSLCTRGHKQFFILQLRMRAMRGLLTVLVTAYAPLVTSVLGMWSCVEVGAHTYLAGDYSLRCDSDEWRYQSGLAAFAFVMYIIGIPLSFYLVVVGARANGVSEYLNLLVPYLRTLTRANRTRAALEAYAAAAHCAGKLLKRRPGGDAVESRVAHELRLGHSGAQHAGAAARASRDLRAAAGGVLDVRCNDLWAEALAVVEDANDRQHELMQKGERPMRGGLESLDTERLVRRLYHFLATDNLSSFWVRKRCGFIFENYDRELWWFENVRAAQRGAAAGLIAPCFTFPNFCFFVFFD